VIPGIGSYAFRWSIGHRDRIPEHPISAMTVLDTAVELGVGVVQYADNMKLHLLADEEIEAVSESARERGVALEIGSEGFDRSMVSQYIGIAERMNAGILRVALDGADAGRPLKELADDLRGAASEARGLCRIAIENHFNYPSNQVVRLLDLVEDPWIGVCLDVANSICAGEWPMETVRLLAPRTINLHMKDYVIEPDPYGVGFRILGAPLGEGRTDIVAVLDALDRRPMSVIYEHWLPWTGDFASANAQERRWTAAGVARLKQAIDRS
jgi:sugar phosphate isomerase/epimerase